MMAFPDDNGDHMVPFPSDYEHLEQLTGTGGHVTGWLSAKPLAN